MSASALNRRAGACTAKVAACDKENHGPSLAAISSLLQSHTEMLMEQKTSIELLVSAHTKEKEELGKQVQRLELAVTTAAADVLQARLEKALEEKRRLEEAESYTSQLSSSRAHAAALESQLESARAELLTLASNAQIASEKLLHREAEVMSLKSRVEEVEGEIEAVRTDLQRERVARAATEALRYAQPKALDPRVPESEDVSGRAAKRTRLEEARLQRRVSFTEAPPFDAAAQLQELDALQRQLAAHPSGAKP